MSGTEATDGVRGLLEIEAECCRVLGEVLERERRAAASHDLGALLVTNKEREATQARWERAARRRREVLAQSGATLDDLVRSDGALGRICDDVRNATRDLRRAQRVNDGLIRAVLVQVNGLIETIRRELPDRRYDRGAALTTPVPGGALTCTA